ncbi:MAG: alpha/beta hydrolase, partial [Pseudomonadota bacterium]
MTMLRIGLTLLILLSVFWCFSIWRSGRQEAKAEAAFPPEGQILDIDGIAVHAVVMGSGPDVVLIHGSSG